MSISKKLIHQVKSHPEIWQQSSRLYKNKIAKARAWKSVAKAIGKDDEFLKKRWKNLKDAFRKELKRIIVKEIEQSQWQYFEDLSFITEEILKGIVKGKLDVPTDIEVSVDPMNDDSDDPLTVKLENADAESNTSIAPSSSCMTYDSSQSDAKNQNLINRKIKNITKQLQENTEELTGDADYLFLVSLLPTLRKLSYVQKLQFRGKVNQWLLDAVAPEFCNDFDGKLNDDFS